MPDKIWVWKLPRWRNIWFEITERKRWLCLKSAQMCCLFYDCQTVLTFLNDANKNTLMVSSQPEMIIFGVVMQENCIFDVNWWRELSERHRFWETVINSHRINELRVRIYSKESSGSFYLVTSTVKSQRKQINNNVTWKIRRINKNRYNWKSTVFPIFSAI